MSGSVLPGFWYQNVIMLKIWWDRRQCGQYNEDMEL